jgi:O-6-methylguanine DNA methyltransferase
MTDFDSLAAGLAALATDAPDGLIDRVAARWTRVAAPIGDVYVASTDQGVAYLRAGQDEDEFATSFRRRFGRPLLPADRPPAGLLAALNGRAERLRLDLRGLSAFEESVLRATMTIPRGEIRPYSWVAREIGNPRAVRAVGTALGHNPVPLLIPCHRVVRADGALGQYVFGARVKEHLLRGESVNVDEVHTLAERGVYYVGSDTTGIFCLPSCHDARRITPEHRHDFRTVGLAVTAGYRPCGHCRPAPERTEELP